MIEMVVEAVLVGAILAFLERKNEASVLDFGGILSIVVATGLSVFLINIAVGFFGLNQIIAAVSLLLFFVIPFSMLKFAFAYSTARSAAYGSVFLSVVIVTQVAIYVVIESMQNV